jgi:hypothetical protein
VELQDRSFACILAGPDSADFYRTAKLILAVFVFAGYGAELHPVERLCFRFSHDVSPLLAGWTIQPMRGKNIAAVTGAHGQHGRANSDLARAAHCAGGFAPSGSRRDDVASNGLDGLTCAPKALRNQRQRKNARRLAVRFALK